jgi:hypothetical protein
LGNNSGFYLWLKAPDWLLPWNADSSQHPPTPFVLDPMDEIRDDAIQYSLAQSSIEANPTTFVRACFYRLGQLWSPLPHQLTADESLVRRWLRYATCGWYCGVYLLAAIGIWRLRRKLLTPPWIWGVLLCVAFAAVHTFYWTNLRMRAPLMPFVAMVAAAGVNVNPKRERG